MQSINNVTTMRVTRSLALSEEKEGGLICMRGEQMGRRISLPCDENVVLGRDATACACAIRDAQVSRKHCVIAYIPAMNQYRVTDNSKNGTFLGNGERLENGREYYLSSGEELYLGNKNNLFKLC